MNEFIQVAIVTYLIMLLAFYLHKMPKIHIPLMSSLMVFDLCVPFYLYFNRDWKKHLIDSGDILSFGVWMHFGLVITLYVLYVIQVQSAMKIIGGGDVGLKKDHRGQGLAILIVRALVIMTGAMMIDSNVQ